MSIRVNLVNLSSQWDCQIDCIYFSGVKLNMKKTTKRRLYVLGIFLVAVFAAGGLSSMKQPPPKKEAKDNALLVETLTLVKEPIDFKISSQGTVQPLINTTLSAEVSGRIIYISDKFVSGGLFQADEVLLEIDPTDYEVELAQARALVKQRQIEYEGAKELRKSGFRAEAELASAEAALAAAKSSLVRAERNLDRTKIRLPYKGIVREKAADLGQYVNPGSRLAVTFAIDTAEVRLPLTDRDLSFLDLPAYQQQGIDTAKLPNVRLSAVQRGEIVSWQARIIRTEGVVDINSRVTFAVAQVIDPYKTNQTLAANDEPVLPMGTYVSAEISGVTIDNLIKVPRSSLRNQSQILVVDNENKLRIRDVDILHTDEAYAYINGGVESGERITLTAIEAPINGMRLRTTDGFEPEIEEQPETQVADNEQTEQWEKESLQRKKA